MTVFVNKTGHVVRMKVGNNQHFSYLASIKDGGEYKMHVNMNDTYREFAVCVDESSKKEIVSSDDCCEFECITIQEMVDGKIELLRQPRESINPSTPRQRKFRLSRLWNQQSRRQMSPDRKKLGDKVAQFCQQNRATYSLIGPGEIKLCGGARFTTQRIVGYGSWGSSSDFDWLQPASDHCGVFLRGILLGVPPGACTYCVCMRARSIGNLGCILDNAVVLESCKLPILLKEFVRISI